jgi:tetratricopeptide (TPR) repeat protein
MKKTATFVILIICTITASAQNIYDLVEKGNLHFMSGEYEMAIKEYQAVVDSGYESAELYYNLGNAYYKSNKFTLALVNYERACLLSPDDEEILHNLEMARQLAVDKIEKLFSWILFRPPDRIKKNSILACSGNYVYISIDIHFLI